MTPLPWRRCGLMLYTALHFLDLGLTARLLGSSGGQVVEGNPVAVWFLAGFGWPGLLGLKLGTLLLSVGLLAFIARHKPRVADRVLALGCCVLLGVVLYSTVLVGWTGTRSAQAEVAALARAERKTQQCAREAARRKEYHATLDRLSEELHAGHCRLEEAVAELSRVELAKDPRWWRRLGKSYPGRTAKECLAAVLLNDLFAQLTPEEAKGEVGRRLEAEFQACYGRSSPLAHTTRGR